MSEPTPLTAEEQAELKAGFDLATAVMPEYIRAAKRVHVSKWSSDWWVGYGKDDSCQIEGTPNHWRWLAHLLLGLAPQRDAPYSEDKPLDEPVARLFATVAELRGQIAKFDADREQGGDWLPPSLREAVKELSPEKRAVVCDWYWRSQTLGEMHQQRITKAESEIEGYRQALERLLPLTDEFEYTLYGTFMGGDPRDFTPDEEMCTPEEISAWETACEEWNRGEGVDRGPGCQTMGDGSAVTGTGFGLGTTIRKCAEREEAKRVLAGKEAQGG